VGLAILCLVGGGYAIYGGFKAIAYTDIIQVAVLILGGVTVTLLGLHKVGAALPEYGPSVLGGFRAVLAGTPEKFHMVMPWNDPELSWVGVFFGGLWLANIFYWGCNQFITQRTLAAKSVWHGQMGAVFAGFLKLLVPFLVVLPGIIAFKLYNADTGLLKAQCVLEVGHADRAFPMLVKQLLPSGFTGLVMAGLMGCVMSHIASMLSASSSIITFDVYRHLFRKEAKAADLVRFGRASSFAILVVATVIAISCAISKPSSRISKRLVVLLSGDLRRVPRGFFCPRANARGALLALVIGPLWAAAFTTVEHVRLLPWPPIPFLFRAGVDFVVCGVIIWVLRTRGDVPPSAVVDRTMPTDVAAQLADIPWYKSFGFWGTLLVLSVVALYVRFF
jgi:SSS family solute:Na+ symporter